MSRVMTDQQHDDSVADSSEEAPPWYQEPKYDRYWTHYRQMEAWMNNYRSAQTSVQQSVTNAWLQAYHQYYQNYQWWMYLDNYHRTMTSYPHPPPPPAPHPHPHPHHHHHHQPHTPPSYPPYAQHHHHQSCPPAPWSSQYHPSEFRTYPTGSPHEDEFHRPCQPSPATTKYRSSNQQYVTDQSDVDYQENGFSETQPEDEDDVNCNFGDEEEFEVELSEEMRQFFLQSQKHKEELKEMRLALSKKRSQEETQEEKEPKKHTQEAPVEDEFLMRLSSSKKSKKKHMTGAPLEQPGKRRTEEMKVLYGKDSPAIHGMETAIQMQFDRNCDKKQPSFWPTVPLKM